MQKQVLKLLIQKRLKEKEKRKKNLKKKFKIFIFRKTLSIIEGVTRTKDERDKKIKEIEKKIYLVTKMSLRDYLNYLNGINMKKE